MAEELQPGAWRVEPEPVRTTLGEWGAQTIVGKAVAVRFEPADFTTKVRIGREVDANPFVQRRPGLSRLYRVGLSLAHMGDKDFGPLEVADRAVEVGRLTIFDLMYLSFCRWAEDECGEVTVAGGFNCPGCGVRIDRARINLLDLGVRRFESEPTITYRLKRRWRFRGQDIQELTLRVPRLNRAIEPLSEADSKVQELVFGTQVAAAIQKVDGRPAGQLQAAALLARDEELRRGIHADDVEGAYLALLSAGGPDSHVIWKHGGECSGEMPVHAPWTTGFF